MKKRALGILIISLVLCSLILMNIGVVSADALPGEDTVINDDFTSTNPQTSLNWEVQKGNPSTCEPYNAAINVVDPSKGYRLTNTNCQWTSLYTKKKITSKNWRVEFSFISQSNSIYNYLGDIGFWIYGDHSDLCNENPALYGSYGIQTDGYTNEWSDDKDAPYTCIKDRRDCPVVDLLKDTHINHLDFSDIIPSLANEGFHNAEIIFNNGQLDYKLDGINRISHDLKTDSSYNTYFNRGGDIGFQIMALSGGSCGSGKDLRNYIKTFELYCTPKTCDVDYPEATGEQDDGCGEIISCGKCSVNSNCGEETATGNPYCLNGDVYQDYTTHTCNTEPPPSFCSSGIRSEVLECVSGEICSAGACIPVTAQWMNMKMELIGDDGEGNFIKPNKGDTVLMILDGAGYEPGTEVIFEVYDYDSTFFNPDDPIRTTAGENAITGIVKDGLAIAKWELTDEDLNSVSDPFGTDTEFIFIAEGIESNLLKVNPTEDNSPPETKIVSPDPGPPESHFIIPLSATQVTIPFNQLSVDEDDDLKITWYPGDGSDAKEFLNCLSTGNCDTTHQYSTSGTKIITLKAEEMTRNQFARDRSRFYIHKKGYNIFSIIDTPSYRQFVFDSGFYNIDGSNSYVEKCYTSEADCIAEVVSPAVCNDPIRGTITSETELFCREIARGEDLTFEWKIDGEIDLTAGDSPTLQKIFVESGEHEIELTVRYDVPD